MAAEETTSQEGNVKPQFNAAQLGLNMDSSIAQVKKGTLTYALNAALENFDSNSVSYQNEQGNELCLGNTETGIPQDYSIIGNHFIAEKNKHIFFIVNSKTGASQIGYMLNNDCVYRTLLSASCLAFDINYPIHKVVHRITNCTTEIYWTDGKNPRRFLDLDGDMPTDCNTLNIQPNFSIPQLDVIEVVTGGELIAGTYQFAIQYCDALGFGYTSYYSITNPVSIANNKLITAEFNYPVNQSIRLNISNLEINGYFKYYNLAVIKFINSIESVELIGTYYIDSVTTDITYSGQNQTQIRLSINDIFEKFPYYDIAEDVTSVQDILIWDNLTSNDRVNYQSIASQISLKWQTYKLPATENYANAINTAELRGYLRDEVYAFEIVFLLKNGKQTDGFHIPGRAYNEAIDGIKVYKTGTFANNDFIGTPTGTDVNGQYSRKWRIYNTASETGSATGSSINNATPWKYGEFAYWQSLDVYPNNTLVWGSLANTPIRHHKFPDVLVSPIFESVPYTSGQPVTPVMQSSDAVYPIGVRIDTAQVQSLINASGLTQAQKDEIAGFKIVRGNRSTNKSIVGKGILRNVGKYEREGTNYYFPNYPYNDLKADPFIQQLPATDINTKSYTYNSQSVLYQIFNVTSAGSLIITDCNTKAVRSIPITTGQVLNVCSLTTPTFTGSGTAGIYGPDPKAIVVGLTSDSSSTFNYINPYGNNSEYITVTAAQGIVYIMINSTNGIVCTSGSVNYTITTTDTLNPLTLANQLTGFSTDASKFRQILNSPETSFGQPTLGSILKIENLMFGAGRAHFVEVKNNARYKFLTQTAQKEALLSSYNIAISTGTFDPNAMFTTYQAYLTIYINGISRKNFSYSFNSVASYDYWENVTNSGNKQRQLDICQYINSGFQSTGDDLDINNFQRESSVYMKTAGTSFLPFPTSTALSDNSRFTASSAGNCNIPEKQQDISVLSYYASLKNIVPSQYGQIYTYETIDTGFQVDFDTLPGITTVFGGDTFISRFAFKTKLPFFIDNRVDAPDDSDIFYDEIGNIAYPRYWHSSRSILYNYTTPKPTVLSNIISVKAVQLDCPNNPLYFSGTTTTTTTTANPNSINPGLLKNSYEGKMYQFAYGIPYFYCETSINVDLRQAFNTKEGDFYPRVSSGIPDNWLQQTNVPIILDNTYYYNTSYSKQNIDNYFSHLPANWTDDQCNTVYPFRAIYSDSLSSDPTVKVNNWLIYRPVSYFDFPQSYGNLTSLDGIQNKAILARFENKSLLYNTMLTIDTSNPQAAYMGNSTLFKSAPPIDFAETDLGYVGSQHKFLLKIPQGQITVDAKRGQIFLISGNQAKDLTAFGSGVNRFMTDHLAFEILRYFPDADVDNHFNGVGLHGVYDSKFDRVIITKLDYIPQSSYVGVIKYGNDSSIPQTYKKYYTGSALTPTIVSVSDLNYFCNKSWTMSFNMNTMAWVSFHTYLPNYYIGENNFFYSGLNEGCDMTFVAAVVIPVSCDLPGGSAIKQAVSTTTTTTTITSGTTTSTTTSNIINCTLTSGSAVKQSTTTTTTTTTGIPTTTTTTTTGIPSTTTTTTGIPTTTTTTTAAINCTLSGGSAIQNGTTTTTTTIVAPSTTTTTTTSAPTTTTTTTTSSPTTTTTTTSGGLTTTTTTTLTPGTTTTTTTGIPGPTVENQTFYTLN
jgi:hypothetical protein